MAYRTVTSGMWGDDRFRRLPHGDAREIWFYLLTGFEVTVLPGLQRSDERLISAGTGLPLARCRTALQQLVELGLVERDADGPLLRIPNAPRHNPPLSGKVIRGWFTQWKLLPDSPLKLKHVESLKASLPDRAWAREAWVATFRPFDSTPNGTETVSESSSERFEIDGQDQEQDQELDQDPPPTPPPEGARVCHSAPPPEGQEPEPDAHALQEVWRTYERLLAPTSLPFTDSRRRLLAGALKSWKPETLCLAIEGYAGSRWWKRNRAKLPSFEQLLEPMQIERGLRCRQQEWDDPTPKPREHPPLPVPIDPTPEDRQRGQKTLAELKQSLPWARGGQR